VEATLLLNSAYNLDGAASCIGYAKYMAFYSKCFALGGRITVNITNLSGATVGAAGVALAPVSVGLVVTTNTTSLGNVLAALENGFCRYTQLGTSPDSVRMTEGADVSRFLHKPRVLDDPQLYSTSSAIPGQVVVAHIYAQALSGATHTTVYVEAVVDVDCVFTDPVVFT